MSVVEGLVIWFLAINLVTVVVYRYDKTVAGSGRSRVRESHLLLLALAGGTLGAYIAMFRIRPRHKAQKASFLWRYWVIVILQMVGIVITAYWQLGQRP